MYHITPETAADHWEVEALYDTCFAPGREALSSYRLRDGVPPVAGLNHVARDAGGILAGAIRYWPICIGAHAALLFHWKSLRRQIRIEGPLTQVSDATADEYFHSRSRPAQLGAVASDQSRPLADREALVARYHEAEARFAGGEVERPAHWTGFTLHAERIEFWLDRDNRLHDRCVFLREGDGWTSTLLFP